MLKFHASYFYILCCSTFCHVEAIIISVPDDVGGVEILAVSKLGRVMPLQIKSSVQHSTHCPGDVKDKLTAIHTLTTAVQGNNIT